MALINCSECDRMASDQADACPHCGAPIAKETAAVQMPPAQAVSRSVGFWLGVWIFLFPVIFVWFLLRKGRSTTSRVIGFAWLGLMVVAMASGIALPAHRYLNQAESTDESGCPGRATF